MSRELALSQLTTELRDFLDLPETLDLPRLDRVACTFDTSDSAPQWACEARIEFPHDQSAAGYRALAQWARYAGGTIEASGPYAGSTWPSGVQRTLSLQVAVAGVRVKLYANVDGTFELPEQAAAANPADATLSPWQRREISDAAVESGECLNGRMTSVGDEAGAVR